MESCTKWCNVCVGNIDIGRLIDTTCSVPWWNRWYQSTFRCLWSVTIIQFILSEECTSRKSKLLLHTNLASITPSLRLILYNGAASIKSCVRRLLSLVNLRDKFSVRNKYCIISPNIRGIANRRWSRKPYRPKGHQFIHKAHIPTDVSKYSGDLVYIKGNFTFLADTTRRKTCFLSLKLFPQVKPSPVMSSFTFQVSFGAKNFNVWKIIPPVQYFTDIVWFQKKETTILEADIGSKICPLFSSIWDEMRWDQNCSEISGI